MNAELIRNSQNRMIIFEHGRSIVLQPRFGGRAKNRSNTRDRLDEVVGVVEGIELISDQELATAFRIGQHTIRLWVHTGLWPLPRLACGTSVFFRVSDVRCWVRTGVWPYGGVFRRPPRGRDMQRIP